MNCGGFFTEKLKGSIPRNLTLDKLEASLYILADFFDKQIMDLICSIEKHQRLY